MDKLKKWAMDWIVKKFLVEKLGKMLSESSGKRTALGVAILAALALIKNLLPLFVPVPPEILTAIDSLMLVVSGATGTFATIKSQKAWEAIKKSGDEVIK